MAQGMNKVILLGNLGDNPELKRFDNGNAVAKLRIATNRKYRDRQDELHESTEWHRVSIWGKRGEALATILRKGETILVEGRLETRVHEKPDGSRQYFTEVHASDVVLMGRGAPSVVAPSLAARAS